MPASQPVFACCNPQGEFHDLLFHLLTLILLTIAMATYIERLNILLGFQDKLTRPLRRVQQNVSRASLRMKNSLEKVQAGLVGVVAGGYGLKRLLAPSLAFESALGRIAPQAGGGAAALDTLRQSALRLNATYGMGADLMVERLSEARSLTRLTGADLEVATKAALLFERQFKTGNREVFAAQAQLQGDWGIGINQANDALAHLLSQGGDKRGELLESLLEYSVQFKTLGFDIQSTIGITQQALQKGWSVDKALDAVKEGGIRLRELGSAQTDALEKLGLDGLANALRTGEVGVVQAMQRIGQKAEKLGGSDKLQVFSALFGAPAEDIGTERLSELLQSVGSNPKTRGALKTLYQHWGKGTDALLSKLRGQLQNVGLAFGGNLLAALTPLLKATTRWLDQVSRFIKSAPDLIRLISLVTAAFLGFVIVGGVLKLMIGVLSLAWISFTTLALLPSLIYTIAFKGGLLALKAATLVMTAAQWALNTAIWASPITWIVAGVIALIAAVVALVVYWDEVKEAMGAVWEVMKGWGQWLVAKFFGLLERVRSILSNIGKTLGLNVSQSPGTADQSPGAAAQNPGTLNLRPKPARQANIEKSLRGLGVGTQKTTNITIHAASAEDLSATINRAALAQ